LQGRLLLHAPAGTCFLLQAALTALQRTAGSKTWPAYRSELLSDAFWAATASHDASLARSEQVRITTRIANGLSHRMSVPSYSCFPM